MAQAITDKLDTKKLEEMGLRRVRGIVRAMLTRMNDYGVITENTNNKTYVYGDCPRRYFHIRKQLLELGLWNPEFDKHLSAAIERRLDRNEMYQVELGRNA